MKVETLNTAEEFENLKDEWNILLENSPSNNLCLTWEWMYTWWKHYNKGKKLFIVKVSDDEGRLLGLAPLCIKEDNLYHFASLKVLTYLGTEEVCSDYVDFIVCKSQYEEVLKIILDYIEKQSHRWHYALLSDISESSTSFKRIIEVLKAQKADYIIYDASTCPYIALPESYEAYTHGLSKNMRYNLRRKTRDIEKKYNATFSVFETSDDLEKAMENLLELHQKRRQMIGDKGDFIQDRMIAFHKEISRIFNEKGILKIYSLDIDGKPVAMIYGFRYGNKFFDYQTGMDPEFERESVGTVLLGHCIRDSIEAGLKEFDFLRGAEPYKFRWTKTSVKTINIILTAESRRGKSYIAVKSLLRRAKYMAKKDITLHGLTGKDD